MKAYLAVYLFFILVIAWVYLRLYKTLPRRTLALAIFTGALLIRVLFLFFGSYTPTNDFGNYFYLGNSFFAGNYEDIFAATQSYQLSKLAGIAVIYGVLELFFSPTLFGVQFINCIFTSLICVEIYFLLCLHSRKAALIAALLYMVYPTSIISSQITSNHHAATMFLLAAFYTFFKGMQCDLPTQKQSFFLFASATAMLLVASDLCHPSVIIVVCAMVAFSVILFVKKWLKANERKEKRRCFTVLAKCAAVCLLYAVLLALSLSVMQMCGLCAPDSDGTLLGKLRVGLDIEHNGSWWSGGYAEVAAKETLSEQRKFCLQEIGRNLADPLGVIKLIWDKTNMAWFGGDGYYGFYFDGERSRLAALHEKEDSEERIAEIEQKQLEVYNKTDFCYRFDSAYVYVIWLFALIGLVFLIRTPETTVLDLTTWFPVGWMAFIAITELQTRYRYPSMPAVVMLSGFGIANLNDIYKKYKKRKLHEKRLQNVSRST